MGQQVSALATKLDTLSSTPYNLRGGSELNLHRLFSDLHVSAVVKVCGEKKKSHIQNE